MARDWKYWFYEGLYYVAAILFFVFLGMRVVGRRYVPKKGGVLLIANHQSYLDPPVIGVAVRRHLNYVARANLWATRFFVWLIETLGAIPIDTDTSGIGGIKATLKLLKEGRSVLIFPEGGRTEDGVMQPLKAGIVLLIRRAKVPIVPVGIAGIYEAWPMHHTLPALTPIFLPGGTKSIAVAIGKPLNAARLAEMEPEPMLTYLFGVLSDLNQRAEKLRLRK